METIIGPRGTGKTRKLIELAYKNKAVLVVDSEKEAHRLFIKSIELGLKVDVISYDTLLERNILKTHNDVEYYVDDVEKLLEYFLPQLKGYTMNIKEEKKYE